MSKNNKESLISDVIKKVVSTGIGAAFMTEDAVKNVLSDLPLPKDIVVGLLANAKATKEEFVTSVKGEIRKYLGNVNISEEIEKVIENYDIEVNAKFTFHRKKPQVKSELNNKKK